MWITALCCTQVLLLLLRLAAPASASSIAPPGRCGSAPCTACTIAEGNYSCNARGYPTRGYTFHLSDTLCPGGNDPNGVFYDVWHGLYHMGWQSHLVNRGCGTIQWGHKVSADFVTWAELPPSIWSHSAQFIGSPPGHYCGRNTAQRKLFVSCDAALSGCIS
eukprot:COSAG02_NODE_8040_length_2738_cov_1.502842_1_plen_162_part_00